MAATDTETIGAALRRAVEEHWNHGDLDGFLAIFADDATLHPAARFPDLGQTVRGLADIRAFFAGVHAPTEFEHLRESGDSVVATFRWIERPGDQWTLVYTFADGKVVSAQYFRARGDAECALAVARGAQLDADTLCAAFQAHAAAHPDRVALRLPGDAVSLTWSDYGERVRALAGGLAGLGLSQGDRVALMLTNRPEFHLADAAAMHLGVAPVSLYNTAPAGQIQHIVGHAGLRFAITERQFVDVLSQVEGLERLFVVDEGGLEELAAIPAPAGFDFDATWRSITADDVLTLIYTSGTTGHPKGVQLSHRNILTDWIGLQRDLRITPGGRVISWMPAAHIADRLLVQYQQLVYGHAVTCCPDAKQLAKTLPDARPTFWVAVPRIWEKLHAALNAGLDDATRAAVERSLDGVAEAADEAVFAGLRSALGIDQAEVHISGAAPLPDEVAAFWHAIGVPVLQVWGMSEFPIITTSPREDIVIGTVGKVVTGAELRLADDGEVLVRGPQVFGGYLGDPEKTAEALDDDGWLHTGDVGALDDAGHLRIVDRKKELIINAAGKNMSPANIEARLKTSSALIGQAVCVGDRRPYNVALIVLDPDGRRAFGDGDTEPAIRAAIQAANTHLSRVEQIKRVAILDEEWQPGGDELTPSQKLKRKPIATKYAAVIDGLYAGSEGIDVNG